MFHLLIISLLSTSSIRTAASIEALRAPRTHNMHAVEGNPLYKPFVKHPMLFVGVSMTSAAAMSTNLEFSHKKNPKLTWLVTGIFTAISTTAAIHDVQTLRRLQKMR